MSTLTAATLVLAAIASGENAGPDLVEIAIEAPDDLQGIWEVGGFISLDGKPRPKQLGVRWVFANGKLIWKSTEGKVLVTFGLSADPAETPKHFDLSRMIGKDRIQAEGIYELRDGDLHLYYDWNGPRPSKPVRPPGGYWYTLRRIVAE